MRSLICAALLVAGSGAFPRPGCRHAAHARFAEKPLGNPERQPNRRELVWRLGAGSAGLHESSHGTTGG
jgi:hypothetical protein